MKVIILSAVLLLAIVTGTCYTASIIPPPPGNQCLAPQGEKGLGPAVSELFDLLPLNELLKIYINAVSHDREVEKVVEYLEGPEFRKIIITMHNTSEFSIFMEYICEELYFDAYYYLNSLGGLLNFPPMTRPPPLSHYYRSYRINIPAVRTNRHGFKGFMLDILDAIPVKKLKEVYERRLAEDEYLKLAMKKIGSEEFRRIGDAIEALPEFQNLLQRLRNLGIDADGVLKAIMDFFGWKVRPPKSSSNRILGLI